METPKFIDYTEFQGKLLLAIGTYSVEQFNEFAAQSEYDLLIYLLNAKLYNDVIADLDVDNNPQTQKFKDLVNGATYLEEGTNKTVNYLGLRDLIRYYVYSVWREEQYTVNTEIGTKIEEAENAKTTNRTQLKIALKKKWNEFVKKYNLSICYIVEHYEILFPDTNDYSNWSPKKFQTKEKIKTGQQTWINPYTNKCKIC